MRSVIREFLGSPFGSHINRSNIAVLLFSRLIATKVSLPTSPVDNPQEFYVTACLDTVQSVVSDLNENLVINVPVLLDLTYKTWLARYDMVFRPFSASGLSLQSTLIAGMENTVMSGELKGAAASMGTDYLVSGTFTILADAYDKDRLPA